MNIEIRGIAQLQWKGVVLRRVGHQISPQISPMINI